MPDLFARGKDPENQWRRTVPDGVVTLGRSSNKNTWGVGWDRRISRMCATLIWTGERLEVRKDPEAYSEIYHRGEPRGQFSLAVGEGFVIGDTTFTLLPSEAEEAAAKAETRALPQAADAAPPPSPPAAAAAPAPPEDVIELVYSRQDLEHVNYAGNDERIEVLASLPEMIRYSPSEDQMEARVVDVLLRGLPRADAVAVVKLDMELTPGELAVTVDYWKGREGKSGEFHPSRRLIADVISRRRQSMMHIWQSGGGGEARADFTVPINFGWAICAPMPDEPFPGWALYVAGRKMPGGMPPDQGPPENQLKGDVKFVELVADIYGSLRQVCYLQHRQTHLARFLSRPVLAALEQKNIDEVLRPRQAEVTVLFCDIRGSCLIADEGQHDLNGLWDRVSEALNIMTSSILDQDGVIGDFQGDAAMGFWGWPLDSADQIERAARAALTIWRRFTRAAQQSSSPLAGFQCGVGIASGKAIAGRLGTHDQYKVGVFGPIVNLASRLESMTKMFHVPILLDERTAQHLVNGQNAYWARCRRLARIRPFGMNSSFVVSELMPAFEPGEPYERHHRDYEAALDAFIEGDWPNARKLLQRVPSDQATRLLARFMEKHDFEPPTNWDGVIALDSK